MQVRRFEARSMKEALEMVKSELGPEAIILSARDNSKRFGLVGDGSVEITAAISEDTIKKRKALESRMRGNDWDNFKKSPSRIQKQALERAFDAKRKGLQDLKRMRYVDIEDDEKDEQVMPLAPKAAVPKLSSLAEAQKAFFATNPVKAKPAPIGDEDDDEPRVSPVVAGAYPRNARVKAAASQAFDALRESSRELMEKQKEKEKSVSEGKHSSAKDHEIASLKDEISGLRKLIEQFQGHSPSAKSSYPGAEYDLPFELSSIFERLTDSVGMLPDFAAEILVEAEETLDRIKLKKKPLVEAFVAQKIYKTIRVTDDVVEPKVNIYMGGRGSGKTATVIKQASHWTLQGKKVAILTTDTLKVGAVDQLRVYAQILNIPFGVLRAPEDWNLAMQELKDVDHILIDFPGMSLKQPEEMQFLFRMLPPQQRSADKAIHLVISATKKDSDIAALAEKYQQVGFNDVIFTCLDEVSQHGVIYNFQKRFEVPLHSFGIGARVPEDFERATKERVVDLIFKLTGTKAP